MKMKCLGVFFIKELTAIAIECLQKASQYDVIVGLIADDKMNMAMQAYAERTLTDEGLIACLRSVHYGNQYVLKTEFACSKVEVLDEHLIYGNEKQRLYQIMSDKRLQNHQIVNRTRIAYRNRGQYLDELLSELATVTPNTKELDAFSKWGIEDGN